MKRAELVKEMKVVSEDMESLATAMVFYAKDLKPGKNERFEFKASELKGAAEFLAEWALNLGLDNGY